MKILPFIKNNKLQLLVLIPFLISLFFNALIVQDYDGLKKFLGVDLLFFGFFSILGGGILEFLIWLANPLALITLFLMKKNPMRAIILSIIAFGIALSFMMWKEILVSESGRVGKIIQLDIGYWLWLFTLFFLVIINIINLKMKKN